MTRQQCEWAQHHDWYLASQICEDGNGYDVIVNDWDEDENGEFPTVKIFNDYQELRQWAGY